VDDIGLGENLDQTISEAISDGSSYFFLFLDEHGFTDWIRWELKKARAKERDLKRTFVLPIFLVPSKNIKCRDTAEKRLLEYLEGKCFERLTNQNESEVVRIARDIDRKFNILLENQPPPPPSILVLKPVRPAKKKKAPKATKKHEFKNKKLILRLTQFMLARSEKVRRIFANSDSFKIAKEVTIELQGCSKDQKETVRGFLARLYAESSGSNIAMVSIRQNCCFYIGRLGTASAKLFLKSTLKTEESSLVKRGIYMGMILSETDGSYLKSYLEKLVEDPTEASINAGYHQCHYGDKFHAEGYHFDESESTEATVRAIFDHLSSKEYRSSWPIDYLTLSFIVYQCSSRDLNRGQLDTLTSNLKRSGERSEDFIAMQQKLHDLFEATESVQEVNGKHSEFYFEPSKYCKKLPHRMEILAIKEEYEKSIYIDGNFLPWETEQNAYDTYQENIVRDQAKAAYLLDRTLELGGLDKSKKLNLLDIGCGYGTFVHAWLKAGLGPAEGVEIAESAGKMENRVYDANHVHRFDARDIDEYPGIGKADVVSAMDFFEHLFNAELFLQKLCRGMHPDASFLLYSPIVSVGDLNPQRLPKTQYFHPQHIYYYTLNGLIEFVERHGFRLVSNKKIRDFKELFLFRKS